MLFDFPLYTPFQGATPLLSWHRFIMDPTNSFVKSIAISRNYRLFHMPYLWRVGLVWQLVRFYHFTVCLKYPLYYNSRSTWSQRSGYILFGNLSCITSRCKALKSASSQIPVQVRSQVQRKWGVVRKLHNFSSASLGSYTAQIRQIESQYTMEVTFISRKPQDCY